MGLFNCPATFQTLMTMIFQDCIEFFRVFMNDIVIFSKLYQEDFQHLETVLSRLKTEKLYVSRKMVHYEGRKRIFRLGESIFTSVIVKFSTTAAVFDAIKTWVDRVSGRVHFIHFRPKYSAIDALKGFFDHIFKLNGLPDDIISELDPLFTSIFGLISSLCAGFSFLCLQVTISKQVRFPR